jgi:hypothetical protein
MHFCPRITILARANSLQTSLVRLTKGRFWLLDCVIPLCAFLNPLDIKMYYLEVARPLIPRTVPSLPIRAPLDNH